MARPGSSQARSATRAEAQTEIQEILLKLSTEQNTTQVAW